MVFGKTFSQEPPIKTFFSQDNNTHYQFYPDRIVTQALHAQATQTIPLNPTPIDYPAYNAIWYQNALHLISERGGLLYRLEKDSLVRLDNSFQHRKQFQSNDFIFRDTLFRYGGYGFWRANNFFTYFDHSTKEWEYYPINSFTMPDQAYDGKHFVLDDTFYVVGGQTVDTQTGLAGDKSNTIWTFDFQNREWTNNGKTGVPIGPYKVVPKGKLFYLIGQPSQTQGDIILDLSQNRATFYDHTLVSSQTANAGPAFFKGDTLYYTRNQTLHTALLKRDIFVNQRKVERLFLNEITLFWNLTYLALAALIIFSLAYGSVLWQRRKRPTLVKGGLRHNLAFYPLSAEEQEVLSFLKQHLSATTEDLLPIFQKQNLSDSQTHKLKSDAIDHINQLIVQFTGKELIKRKKDPKDKRQAIYYFKRNILH